MALFLAGICFYAGIMAQPVGVPGKISAGKKNRQISPAGPKALLSYKIIAAPENTFGYEIFSNGKIMIRQASIPAVQGNRGFATKQAAMTVAKLVIKKINNRQMPPSITIDEMKKLKAI